MTFEHVHMCLQDNVPRSGIAGSEDMSICNFGSYKHITLHREKEYIFVSIHQSSIHVSVNENVGFLMVSYDKGVHGQVLGFLILIKW